MSGRSFSKALLISVLVGASALAASPALAEVRHLGDWDSDPEVTLDLDSSPRDEAVKRLAAAAGWSLVSRVPPGEPIDIHVRGQRAGKILDLLLTDGDYVAKRDGTLLAVSRVVPGQTLPPASAGVAGAPPVPPLPPLFDPPAPPDAPDAPDVADSSHASNEKGSDREVFGHNLQIEKGEIVNDVSVVGGNVDVFGTVKGDLTVTGGNVRVHGGARVMGDLTAMGGNVTLDDHARVDGDVATVGGDLRRGKTAEIHGDVKIDDRDHGKHKDDSPEASMPRRVVNEVGDAITAAALLFVVGAVLLSLATTRMETLKIEIASRPMRTFAMGIVGLLGWIGVIVALCITVVGIPLALAVVFGGIVALFAGLTATLETIGRALIGHKSKNPYAHLAFGCGLFIAVGLIPVLGGLVKFAVVFTAIGSVAATRGAGYFPAKNKPGGGPYRDVATSM